MAEQPARSSMPAPPLRLRLLVTAVALAAVAALALSSRGGLTVDRETALAALLLAAMVALAHVFPLQIGPKVQVSVDTAPAFAAALLLPAPWAILVSILGIGAGEAWRRTARVQLTYNVAVAALRSAAATVAFHALSPAPIDVATVEGSVAAVAAAALVMYAVNTGLIDLVVGVQRRVSPFAGWWGRHRGRIAHEASLYLTGVLLALAGAVWTPALLLLAAPALTIYRALRDSVAAQQRGRDALEDLADVLDERVPYTAGHSRRVAELARILALRAGMTPAAADEIYQAARLQNLGMAALRTSMLQAPGLLTEAERAELRTHPAMGVRLLARFPQFTANAELVLSHHERWDGRGYPRGLRGEEIPRGARVIALVDALVAMRTRRPYRPLLPAATVRAELVEGRGTQFDPALVDLLISLFDRLPEFDFEGVLLFGDTGRQVEAPVPRTGRIVPRGATQGAER